MSDGFLKTKQPLRGKGLLMVSNGTQISGFSQKIGSASSLVVELVSFLGFTRVIVELDALLVVSFLNVPVKIHTKLVLLVDDCRSLLQRIPNSQVLYDLITWPVLNYLNCGILFYFHLLLYPVRGFVVLDNLEESCFELFLILCILISLCTDSWTLGSI